MERAVKKNHFYNQKPLQHIREIPILLQRDTNKYQYQVPNIILLMHRGRVSVIITIKQHRG